MDSTDNYSYTKIPLFLFDAISSKGGKYGPSVNECLKRMWELSTPNGSLILGMKRTAPSKSQGVKGVKIPTEMYDWLRTWQARLKKDCRMNVPISDLIAGLYLETKMSVEGVDSYAQGLQSYFPGSFMFLEFYVWNEGTYQRFEVKR